MIEGEGFVVVIVLTGAPSRLRGDLTRWLYLIAPGVYVGKISERVRQFVWRRVSENLGRGRALLIYSSKNEQGFLFEGLGYQWDVVDYDGVALLKKPNETRTVQRPISTLVEQPIANQMSKTTPARSDDGLNTTRGWSIAARRRRFRHSN